MQIQIDALLEYFLPQPSDVLLAVEALPMADQTILSDNLEVTGPNNLRVVEGLDQMGRRRWMEANGHVSISYRAVVEVTRAPVNLAGKFVPPRRELPAEVIPFLFPSRYCESDRLERYAMRRFSGAVGGDQVLMMADWIYNNFDYVPGASNEQTTATDSFLSRQGVCRDYAHVLISFCRAVGIPARMVSAYAPGLQPPDFHAVVEVWLDGAWHLVDPARMSLPENLVRIAFGRDATDISFMTIFGMAELNNQWVSVAELPPSGA